MINHFLQLFAFLLLFTSCSNPSPRDNRLNRVADLASDSPEEALDLLTAINYDSLLGDDKHFYDFLLIKASDKAYIMHTSDSLILEVIDYEANHPEFGRYPEALYYGGRVYSDLGDYPTALNYFQSSLDCLSDDEKNPKLKSAVLSQTGRLLNSLRLYDEAVPYLEAAIEVDKLLGDTLNEFYDLQLLGTVYLRKCDYERSEHNLSLSLEKGKNLPMDVRNRSKVYLAATKYESGDIEAALSLIRNIPELTEPAIHNTALAAASEIYQAAGILDSAYLYACELAESPEFTNRKIGYHVLISPEMQQFLDEDDIRRYALAFGADVEESLDMNGNQFAINQQSFYNYRLHERERAKAEKSNERLRQWIVGFSFLVLFLGIVILYLKNKNKNNIIKLHVALSNVDRLERSLKSTSAKSASTLEMTQEIDFSPSDAKETLQGLRMRLRNKLVNLYNENAQGMSIAPLILNSDAYQKLQGLISRGEEFREHNKLWKELEDVVLGCSPKFKENLCLLAGGKLTTNDLRTAILIKCGVTPTQMAVLFNRTKGAIVSRRESLCLRIFDEKLGTKVIDGVIRLL